MIKKIFLSTLFLLAVTIGGTTLISSGTKVSAAAKSEPDTAVTPVPDAPCSSHSNFFLGLPTWYKYLDHSGTDCEITLPTKNGETDVPKTVSRVLLAVFEIALRIGGMVAVVFVIYGGFQFILSQGEPEKHKGARSTIINALIGMAITISATAIVNLIGKNLK